MACSSTVGSFGWLCLRFIDTQRPLLSHVAARPVGSASAGLLHGILRWHAPLARSVGSLAVGSLGWPPRVHDLRRQRGQPARSRVGISKRHRQTRLLAAPHRRWLVQACSPGERASRWALSGRRASSPSERLRPCAGDHGAASARNTFTCTGQARRQPPRHGSTRLSSAHSERDTAASRGSRPSGSRHGGQLCSCQPTCVTRSSTVTHEQLDATGACARTEAAAVARASPQLEQADIEPTKIYIFFCSSSSPASNFFFSSSRRVHRVFGRCCN